jgi:hypothetical protein
MSLEKWLENGWLRREPSSANEIKALQGIVQRSLDDSKVETIPAGLRFVASFTAALTAATIALRASGYRTRYASQPSYENHRISGTHHQRRLKANPETQGFQQQAK